MIRTPETRYRSKKVTCRKMEGVRINYKDLQKITSDRANKCQLCELIMKNIVNIGLGKYVIKGAILYDPIVEHIRILIGERKNTSIHY